MIPRVRYLVCGVICRVDLPVGLTLFREDDVAKRKASCCVHAMKYEITLMIEVGTDVRVSD